MTLLDLYLRAWMLREQGILSKYEHDLYGYFLYKWNLYGKQNPFSQSTEFICDFLKINKKSFLEHRNSLMQKGLIDFEKGESNSFAAKYTIILGAKKNQKPPPKRNQNHPQNVTKTTTEIREDTTTIVVVEKSKPKKFDFGEVLISEHGCDKQHVIDWMKTRKDKKASNTQTALNKFLSECAKNNFDVKEAVRICAERSWSGFEVGWLKNDKSNNSNYGTNNRSENKEDSSRIGGAACSQTSKDYSTRF